MGERSLVAFTLLTQAAAGALVGLVGVRLLGAADVLGPLCWVVVGLLLLVAAAISTAHLGAPRHAPYAILNWRRSWLSREILGLGLSGGLVALGALVALLADPAASQGLRTAIAILAAVAALFTVAAMAQLYAVRTIPEWQLLATATAFVGSTLRQGSVVAALLAAMATLPDGSIGITAAWLVVMLGLGMGLWLLAANDRIGGTIADRRAGALLVRGGMDSGGSASHAATRFAVGTIGAAAGMVTLGSGPAIVAAFILAPTLLILAVAEVQVRECFYDAAPSRGRDVMRPATAARATRDSS